MSSPGPLLIGTPVRTGLSLHWTSGMINALAEDLGRPVIIKVTARGGVNFARNELADMAIDLNAEDILFVDDDIPWGAAYVKQIVKHDVDIVGGIYAKRQAGPPQWFINPLDGAEVRDDGLLEVEEVGAGFLRIKVSALHYLSDKMPDRHYQWEPRPRCEFFPMGVIGDGTAEGRLDAITAIMAENNEYDSDAAILTKVREALVASHPPGVMFGEDYYFCKLARKHGLRVYADTRCMLRHIGETAYPEDKYWKIATTNPEG